MDRKYTFTSESVTEGHPDKMADQISDSVLDAILAEDPHGRVACETLLTTGLCVVAGEITTSAYVDIPKLARSVIKDIGYDNAAYGFDGNTCGVIISIDEQSSDIAMGVDKSEISRETNFQTDLNADSLDIVELVMEFEDEFETNIPDDQAEKIQNIGQAIDYIKANMNNK